MAAKIKAMKTKTPPAKKAMKTRPSYIRQPAWRKEMVQMLGLELHLQMLGLEHMLKSAASAANSDISRILKDIDAAEKKGKVKGNKKTENKLISENKLTTMNVVHCFTINKLVKLLIPDITCGV